MKEKPHNGFTALERKHLGYVKVTATYVDENTIYENLKKIV